MIQVYDGGGERIGRPRPSREKVVPIPRNCFHVSCVCNKPGELSYHTQNGSQWYIVSRRQALRIMKTTRRDATDEIADESLATIERVALEGQITSFEQRDRQPKFHNPNSKTYDKTWRELYPWTVEERLAWNKANPDRDIWSKS